MIRLLNKTAILLNVLSARHIAAIEFAVICGLGLLLWASSSPETVRTVVERDTVETVRVDTVEVEVEGSERWSLPELPEPEVLQEADADTTVSESSDSTGSQPDTVFISTVEPILQYRVPITNPHFTGTITSVVQGRLLNQEFDYTLRTFEIHRLKKQTVNTRTTHYQRERLRLNAGFSVGGNLRSLTEIEPMIGVERPGRWEVYYGYNIVRKAHGLTVMTPLLTR